MSAAVQRRRGTTAQTNAFTGFVGEITVDTDRNVAVVHDGVRAGGYAMARADQVFSVPPGAVTGDLFCSTGGAAIARLADVAVGSVLVSGGVGAAPAWSTGLPAGMTIATPPAGDTSTKIANMAAVATAIAALVNSSPTALDTLKELADAIGDDPNFAVTITNYVASKANKGANSDITSLSGLTTALSIAQGGTGAGSGAGARAALGAAANGANTDITSLAGLTTPIPLAEGGTGATDAKTARSALGLDKVTLVGDAAYVILSTDRTVLLTAALTAPRAWTLPAASAMNPGAALRIADQAGGISGANTLTLSTSGADKINGASSVTFAAPFTDFQLVTDGNGKWTFDVQGVARGGTGATTAAAARSNLGAAAAGANTDITSLQAGATIPTAPAGDTSTKIANMAALSAAIANVLGSAPPALLQTLQAIDTAINNDPNFYNDIMAVIATKAAKGANSDITSLSGLTTALSLAQGGTGATDAKTARAALGLDKATLVGDAAYTILATDRTVLLSAALTAPRIWTLPATSGMNAGAALRIADEVAGISTTNTLTLAASGSDKINGAASVVFSAPYTDVQLVTDGAGKWTFDIQGVARGGTGATTAAAARTNLAAASSGGNTDITSLSGLTTPLSLGQGGTGAATAAAARTALGLDTMAQQSAGNVAITGGSVSGTTVAATTVSVSGPGSVSTSGGFVHWNRSDAAQSGGTSFLNQKGGGAGGFYFAESTTANATTESAYIGPSGSASRINSQLIVPALTATGASSALNVTDRNGSGSGSSTFYRNGGVGSLYDSAGGDIITFTSSIITFKKPPTLPSFTVATLPAAGTAGRVVLCSNARMFNGAGTQEASGSGTGGVVSDNGSAWKIVGTNVTASA